MIFRRLLRVLDYAYLFFSLVILSSLLWASAGLILIGIPLWLLSTAFTEFSDGVISLSNGIILTLAAYIACVFGSIGLFWGWKRWRSHLNDEARRAQALKSKK